MEREFEGKEKILPASGGRGEKNVSPAEGGAFELTKEETKTTLEKYKKALKELKYL